MHLVTAPAPLPQTKHNLFLAGSIDNGLARDWQNEVITELQNTDWTIFNPRRQDWNRDWQQSESHPEFRRQVSWELAAQEFADVILMYFEPQFQSPISLLELGLFARSGKMMVVCPEGYWRKGNVDIVCNTYQIQQYASLSEAIQVLKTSDYVKA